MDPNDLVRANPGVWFETYGRIRDTSGQQVTPRMNVLQRRINALYVQRLMEQQPLRAIGLKPRKRGFSTMVAAIHYAQLQNFAHQGVVIGDKLETADVVYRMMSNFADHDGFKLKWGSKPDATSERMRFPHGSLLLQATARGKATARGMTPQFIHGCVPPGTPVILEHGRVVPIEEVPIGSKVLTHTGAATRVTDKIGQENWKGPMIRITPWLGQPICFTTGHKIPTARGILEAQEVREDDELCLPIRPITRQRTTVRMPETPERTQRGGLQGKGSGSEQTLDEDFGFVCGYYLAEGCAHGRTGFLTSVVFARHRDEVAYADRVAKRIEGLTTKRFTKDRENSLTTQEIFYSAILAKWLVAEFGRLDGKRIPDWVFEAGGEFCRGLLSGLLSGDGSKKRDRSGGYDCQKMVLTTTRASLAMQARDIAAALGYGWASCRVKEAGQHYGRNCKACWRVVWNGEAARSLHKLVTGEEIPSGRKWVEKYRITDGRVWLRVRKIETGIEVPFMWDLSVEHEDHTFRTPHFAIGNTEVAHWEAPEEAMDASMNAVPDSGFNTVFWESTPFGAGEPFAQTWEAARWPSAAECPKGQEYWRAWEAMCPDQPPGGLRDRLFVRVFAAWYEFDESVVRLTPDQKREIRDTLDSESWYRGEQKLIDLYGNEGPVGQRLGTEVVDADVWEQLAWRRLTIKTKCRGSVRIFDEEHPADPRSCFLASGRQVFDEDGLTHIQLLCREAPTHGDVNDQDGRATWRPTTMDAATVWRWEAPKVGCRYLISADLAEGADQTKGDNPDAHSALVWRDEFLDERGVLWPIKLAARVRPPNRMPMIPFARLVRALSWYYGNCMIIPEMNNSGMSFITALRMMDGGPCPPIWQRRERDPHSGTERAWDGWRTTDSAEYKGVRATIIWHMHELLRNKAVEIRCPHMATELADFVDKGGRMEAGSGHDDDVLSAAIGLYNIGSATEYARAVRVDFMPRDVALLEARDTKGGMLAMKW